MANKQRRFFSSSTAQTATELAVFGAILIFVLGLIIRYAVNFNNVQGQSLKAMRMAMRQSFLSGQENSSSRNVSSILFVEDRKDIDATGRSGKFGTESRTPYVLGSSGTFTKNLMMPSNYGEASELPIMDVFINGKHFPFTMGSYKTYCLLPDQSACMAESERIPNLQWESNLAKCSTADAGDYKGCAVVFTKIPNTDDRFDSACNMCFDLNRNGTIDANEPSNPADRARFAWQWLPVKATTSEIDIESGSSLTYDVDGDLKEESVLEAISTTGRDYVSRSPFEGAPEPLAECSLDFFNIAYVKVIDLQAGDIDATYNDYDIKDGRTPATNHQYPFPKKEAPGLTSGTKIYTVTKDGTYLSIEEKKLYNNDQFVRNIQMGDRVHMVERVLQLSNDTGRMCSPPPNGIYNTVDGPVEACCSTAGCCSAPANVYKTCFEHDPKSLKLYVRSLIKDIKGRKWITDVSADQMPVR